MSTLKLLNQHMQGGRFLYLASWIAIALAAFFELLQPQLVRIILDIGLGGEEWTGLQWIGNWIEKLDGTNNSRGLLLPLAAMSVVLMAFSGLFLYLKGRWSAIVAEDTARGMRDRLFGHLQDLDYNYHVQANTGDLIQRCTSDVETIRSFLATQAVEIGRGVFQVIFTALIMFRLDRNLTWVAMAAIPGIFGFCYFFFRRVQQVFEKSDEAEGRLSATLQENIQGIRVVRAFARQDYEIEKFDVKNRDYRDEGYRLIRLEAWYWSVSDLLCFIQIGLVMSIGGWWAASGRISLGTAVVFFTYVARLLWPIREMGRILTEMGKTMVALERIQEILDTPKEAKTGDYRKEILGHVEYRNVSFRYGTDRPILKDIDFRLNPGEIVAILGPTGSGKSTLAHLLTRLYDPTDGMILIDGIPSTDWDRRHLRRQICIILQEPFLFNRTVKENIALAVPHVLDEEILASTRTAALHDVIESFEKSYETIVGEGGVTLSGGQKQRMALARAVIRNPKIIILDDSLSAVDAETDEYIRQNLRQEFPGSTVLIIAHRASTLKEAHRILVLENGQITQEGRHEDLSSQDGLYKRIWDIQNAGAQEAKS